MSDEVPSIHRPEASAHASRRAALLAQRGELHEKLDAHQAQHQLLGSCLIAAAILLGAEVDESEDRSDAELIARAHRLYARLTEGG